MTSRRMRKRQRRKAEATVHSPGTCGGWGGNAPTTQADLVILRRAIKQGWPVPPNVRQAIFEELIDEVDSSDPRRATSVAMTFLAMSNANLQLRESKHSE